MAIFNKFQRAKQVAEILLRYGLDEFFERSNLERWLPESLSTGSKSRRSLNICPNLT